MNRGETAPFFIKTGNQISLFIEIDVNFSFDYLPTGNEEFLEKYLFEPVDYPTETENGTLYGLEKYDFFAFDFASIQRKHAVFNGRKK